MVGRGIFFAFRIILRFSWKKIAASHWSDWSNRSNRSDRSDRSDQSDKSNLKLSHRQQANIISALENKGAINKTTSAEICITPYETSFIIKKQCLPDWQISDHDFERKG